MRTGEATARFERIVEKLNGRSHLLLVDQVHNLREAKGDKPLYILADLYDATQTAQLWSGTADLVTYLDRQRSKAADESLGADPQPDHALHRLDGWRASRRRRQRRAAGDDRAGS